MEIRIRHIAAKCQCGGSDFTPSTKPPFHLNARFTCSSCASQATYGELLDRIGAEAVRQARAALEALKKKDKE